MCRFTIRKLWSAVVSLFLAANSLPATAADATVLPDTILMMNGSWAANYNRCVEPSTVISDGKNIKFHQRNSPDQIETVTSTEPGIVHTSDNKGGEVTYYVSKDRIYSSDSKGHVTTVIRCWSSFRQTEKPDSCKNAIRHFGSADALARRVQARLREIGISPYINVNSVISGSSDCTFAFSFLEDAEKLLNLSSLECEPLYLREVKPLYRLPADGDLSLNYGVLNDRIPHDARFESCFEEKNGMSVWDKVIVLIYNEFSIPLANISLFSRVEGCHTYNVWYALGSARFRPTGCNAGISVKRPIPTPSPIVASATISNSASQIIDPDGLEKAFDRSFSSIPGAKISILDRDDDHITYVIRGLRNQVIVGSNYWEKLVINVFIWRNFVTTYEGGDQVQRGFHSLSSSDRPWQVKQSLQFRVITEGSYSAGSGSYPKDEFFTQSMEPEFHDQLTEFANKIAKTAFAGDFGVTP